MNEDQSGRIKHPNQTFSQIFLPFLFAFAVVAYAGYFLFSTLVSGSADFRMWSDISVIIIFLPLILLALPGMMILLAHIFLVVKIQQKVLGMGEMIRPLFTRFVTAIANLANLPTKPLIALKSGISFFMKQK